MTLILRLALVATALVWAQPVTAQCPDGSPPPCQPARRASVVPAPNSIAVLYFDNLTRDSAYAYLADGLTEDLITLLGRVARLDVKSRYESARIRGAHGLGPSDIGRELRVAYFVGGSVQPGSGRIRVNAELIEARTGRRVWGEGLTASGTDPLAVQESITNAVVQAVVGQLLASERAVLLRRATRDSAAYDLYLRGRFFESRGTESDLRQALELYQEALIHDSTFGLAWAGIANAWIWLSDTWVRPVEAFAHVRDAAERAIVLDSSAALAHLALAYTTQQFDRDYARAEALARRAIALDPRMADAHAGLSVFLVNRGRSGEALMESQRAWQLDSLSDIVRQVRMSTLATVGRAIETLALARSLHSKSWEVQGLLLLQRCAEAQDVMRRDQEVLRQENEKFLWFQWALAAACMGEQEKARAALDSIGVIARNTYVAPIVFAVVHAAMGNVDEAFRWFERADENRDFNLLFINVPTFWMAQVQADPRFAVLMRRLGLPWPAPQLPN